MRIKKVKSRALVNGNILRVILTADNNAGGVDARLRVEIPSWSTMGFYYSARELQQLKAHGAFNCKLSTKGCPRDTISLNREFGHINARWETTGANGINIPLTSFQIIALIQMMENALCR